MITRMHTNRRKEMKRTDISISLEWHRGFHREKESGWKLICTEAEAFTHRCTFAFLFCFNKRTHIELLWLDAHTNRSCQSMWRNTNIGSIFIVRWEIVWFFLGFQLSISKKYQWFSFLWFLRRKKERGFFEKTIVYS